MVPPLGTAQNVSQAGNIARPAAAGARGLASVERNPQVNETSETSAYAPDKDGLIFNAYLDSNGQRQSEQRSSGDQRERRVEQSRVSAARRASDREGAITPADGSDFMNFLDPDIPLDLRSGSGPRVYAVVNAVVHGVSPRGTRFDALV